MVKVKMTFLRAGSFPGGDNQFITTKIKLLRNGVNRLITLFRNAHEEHVECWEL